MSTNDAAALPLAGVRVLDASTDLAGAYCTKLLTDLGADAVVAEPAGGSPLRADGPGGGLFAYLRSSQRSVTGDLSGWMRGADVVVRSIPGVEVSDSGAAVRVTISALGRGGPDDGLDLPEPVLQARSGALSGHGHMGTTPLTVGGRIGEYVTGVFAALAAVTALRARGQGSAPIEVDVSKLEAMQLTMLTVPTVMARFPGGSGRTFRFVMIPGNEPTRDGKYVGITTVTAAQWKALLAAMGRDDLIEDTQLHTMIGRFSRAKEVTQLLREWTLARDAADIEATLTAARVPVAVLGDGATLPDFEHLRARGTFVAQPGAAFGRPRAPLRFHGAAAREIAAAPAVGANSGEAPWTPRRERDAHEARDAGDRKPLAGIRVVDFTAFWSGPCATAWLAALGADVVKIESHRRPDGIRFSAMVSPRDDPEYYEKSALFHVANLGKRGITLDLSRPEGVGIAKRLIARCDVVAENFTPRVMESFGLGYEEVRALKRDVVMLRLPAFGLDGPWRDRPGFAQTMEQITGMAAVTGYAGGPPVIPGGVVDPLVGAHAALALVAALAQRDRTGAGRLVEVAMVDVAIAITAEQVITAALTGVAPGRRGEGGVYRGAGDDAWVAVDTAHDPLPAAARAEWCAAREPAVAAAELMAAGIPAAAMVPGHLTDEDPQLRARHYFERVEHALMGAFEVPTWPARFTTAGGTPRYAPYWERPAPLLGQHNHEVLVGELGIGEDEYERLVASGVIGSTFVPG